MVSANVFALAGAALRKLEGCRLTPYRDSGGVWSVGVGHLCGRKRVRITLQEEAAFLQADMARIAGRMDWGGLETLTEKQKAALLVFAFNVGAAAFNRSVLRSAVVDALRGGVLNDRNPVRWKVRQLYVDRITYQWKRWRFDNKVEV